MTALTALPAGKGTSPSARSTPNKTPSDGTPLRLPAAPLDGKARVRLHRQRARADGRRRVEITVSCAWHAAALKLLARALARLAEGGTRRDAASARRRLRRLFQIWRDEEIGRPDPVNRTKVGRTKVGRP